MKTINDLYIESKSHNKKLLSDYSSDFWTVYRNNYQHFDRYFKTKYKTFEIREQEPEENITELLTDFNNNVTDFLMINEKRFNELYRVQVVPDNESYNIMENYYLEETYTGTGSNNETYTGNGSNVETYTGNVDNQSTSASGQRTDVTNFEQGNQKQTSLDSVSAYNTNNLNSRDKNESETGTRNDVTQYTEGGQELTNHSINTDTHSSNTTTNDGHTRNNATNDSHTLTRHGAIGTMTADDVMEKHINLWRDHFNFYNIIFDEIAEMLLKVGC